MPSWYFSPFRVAPLLISAALLALSGCTITINRSGGSDATTPSAATPAAGTNSNSAATGTGNTAGTSAGTSGTNTSSGNSPNEGVSNVDGAAAQTGPSSGAQDTGDDTVADEPAISGSDDEDVGPSTPAIATGDCNSDADCETGSRCCVNDGRCYATVGSGEICDCQHPCSGTEGCFPGTCGEPPYRCRPGCFPGAGAVKVEEWDPDKGPDPCGNQKIGSGGAEHEVPAYCSPLPENEITESNKGGACRPASSCSVIDQNCPQDLLFRDQPSGPDNPIVDYNCVPVAKGSDGSDITACYPAGGLKLGDDCEARVCGDRIGSACGVGMICSKLSKGDGGYACKQQCGKPELYKDGAVVQEGDDEGCPTGTTCGALLPRWGNDPYKTGACEVPRSR